MGLGKLKVFLFVALMASSVCSHAAIIFAGGEDTDFPLGVLFNPSATGIRTGYARVTLSPPYDQAVTISNPFPSGTVTSVWLSARVYWNGNVGGGRRLVGLGKSATGNSIWFGVDSGTAKLAIIKYDGTTQTQLASEAAASLLSATVYKIDMQIINYGAAATVNVYLNGGATPRATYTGDITTGGNTSLNDVRITGQTYCCSHTSYVSEVLVSDVDTRMMSVVTLAPNAAGSTNAWSGAYTDINETILNDSTLVSSSTSGQIFQCNLTDLPAGTFDIQGVRISARAAKAGTGISGFSAGVYTNTTVSVPAATTLSVGYSSIDTYYQLNPVTASPWTMGEINNLQMNLQSAP